MMPAPLSILYTTTATEDDAKTIATTLVRERLVACANIIPGGMSIVLENETPAETPDAESIELFGECYLLLKTTERNRDAAIGRIEELHPYHTPCVLAWRTADGSEPFVNWASRMVTK